MDAEQFWRKEANGFGPGQSVWVISLDAERRFLGCDQVAWRFFAQPILLADEVLIAAKKRGAEEFIFLHYRPGFSPASDLDSKTRARAIILSGRQKECSLVDYLIIGERNEKYVNGLFSLCHMKAFHQGDPFPPKPAKKAPRPKI